MKYEEQFEKFLEEMHWYKGNLANNLKTKFRGVGGELRWGLRQLFRCIEPI